MDYNEQELERRKSLNEIIDIGLNPYPSESFEINISSKNIKENYSTKKNDKKFKDVVLAGRLMSRRIMGSASFAEIMDSSGKIQLYIRRDDICEGDDKSLYNDIFKKKLDLGDIIGISGFVFETKLGEITIHVKSLKLLSKSLKPIYTRLLQSNNYLSLSLRLSFNYFVQKGDLHKNPISIKGFVLSFIEVFIHHS